MALYQDVRKALLTCPSCGNKTFKEEKIYTYKVITNASGTHYRKELLETKIYCIKCNSFMTISN